MQKVNEWKLSVMNVCCKAFKIFDTVVNDKNDMNLWSNLMRLIFYFTYISLDISFCLPCSLYASIITLLTFPISYLLCSLQKMEAGIVK